MPLRNLIWLLIIPGLVGLGLAVGYSAPAPDQDYQLLRQFVEVMAEVDANYVRELTPEEKQKFIEDAINGGLRKLDPHSTYLNEKNLKEFDTETEGSFGGVGILLGQDEKTKRLKISYPLVGTPAYNAGLIANDIIAKIDGTETKDMTGEQATKLVKGEVGTKVTLTILRGDKELPPFTLTRARIAMHPVSGVSRRADDPTKWNWFIDPESKIALIRIASFSGLATDEVKEAMKEIEAAGGKALILDLRDNPGGLLEEATKLADLFLTEGKIVTTKGRNSDKTVSAKGAGTIFLPAEQKPMVVLVNHDSASASEIVAAALQDNNRAVVVGERTYGKGSVQSVFRIAPDQKTAVKLTTQTWWRPNGKNMDKLGAPKDRPDEWGVTPNEGLDAAMSDPEYLRYRVELQKLDYVAGKPDVVGPNPPPPPPILNKEGKPLVDESKPFVDPQVKKAIDYLRKKLSGVGAVPLRNVTPAPGIPS